MKRKGRSAKDVIQKIVISFIEDIKHKKFISFCLTVRAYFDRALG